MRQLKQQILWSLSGGVGILRPSENLDFMAYNSLYWRVGRYKQASIRGAANELIVNNLVTKILRGKMVQLRLTRVGRDALLGLFPLVFRGSWASWDKNWRLIIANARELKKTEKRKLKKILPQWGFVKLGRGIYVSPFGGERELSKKIVDSDLGGAVKILLTKKFWLGDDRAFANEVWKLDTIYNSYVKLSSQIDRLLHEVIRVKSLTDQLKNDYRQCLSAWFEVLKNDPGLPKNLLPDDWPTLEIGEKLEKVNRIVRELEGVSI